jgi:hypothetical protein
MTDSTMDQSTLNFLKDRDDEIEEEIMTGDQIEFTRLAPAFPSCLEKYVLAVNVPELKEYQKPKQCPRPPV